MNDPVAGSSTLGTVVALGGGHGISATLRALTGLGDHVVGIVGTVDDGGSSGRLREHLGILPPGDLRMALAALMPDSEESSLWRAVLQHRFDGSVDIGGHALGNLLLAAMWEETGDVVAALEALADALRAQGRVLPHALEPCELTAVIVDNDTGESRLVRGQAQISQTQGTIKSWGIEPANPQPCIPAENAIRSADLIVFGPGSWYTSVLPHLLVPGISRAIDESPARRVLVVNLAGEPGESAGYQAHQYLESWHRLFPKMHLDVVLADEDHIEDPLRLHRAAQEISAVARIEALSEGGVHDPDLLRAALIDVMDLE